MSRKKFYLGAFAVVLLIAGVVSIYASSHPDGLEFVAHKLGLLDHAKSSPADHGPMAGYQVRGLGGSGVSGGLAGVIGVVVVLAITIGLTKLLKRRPHDG